MCARLCRPKWHLSDQTPELNLQRSCLHNVPSLSASKCHLALLAWGPILQRIDVVFGIIQQQLVQGPESPLVTIHRAFGLGRVDASHEHRAKLSPVISQKVPCWSGWVATACFAPVLAPPAPPTCARVRAARAARYRHAHVAA
jgi:hypothetical protein